jgi:hypothetical protein
MTMIDYKSLSAETVVLILAQIHKEVCKKLDCAECNVFENVKIKNWLEQ